MTSFLISRPDVAVIGCGLIGGSLALSLRYAQRHLPHYSFQIVAVDSNQDNLNVAKQRGLIDAAVSLEEAAQARVCVLATPVLDFSTLFAALAPHLAPDTLLIDVGSTKGNVIEVARRNLGSALARFVPCHPIAGSAQSGPMAARLGLFDGRYALVTPLPENSEDSLQRAVELWHSVGAWVLPMEVNAHDQLFAGVSHLPHMVAYALMGSLLDLSQRELSTAGPSLQEMTRTAGSSAVMWRDIALANREALLQRLSCFGQEINTLKAAIEAGDGEHLLSYFSTVSERRNDWRRQMEGLPIGTRG